jgi:hypothetical protein
MSGMQRITAIYKRASFRALWIAGGAEGEIRPTASYQLKA